MLLTTVVLWALNLSVTKYILEQGLEPLSYATVRYALAGAIFVVLTLVVERTLRIERRHVLVLAFASVALWLNQLCFVFALDKTTASTIGLILGAIPIFAALFGLALGRERLNRRFWLGAGVSFVGVGLVAIGAGSEVSGGYAGILLGLGICATWAAYSVAVAPLMATYSPSRVSAVVIPCTWVLLVLTGHPADERAGLGSGMGGLGAARVRDDRPARAHEHPLVPLDLTDRAGARDAGGEPPALRRGRPRRDPALRAARPAADPRRLAHRERDRSRPPPAAFPCAGGVRSDT